MRKIFIILICAAAVSFAACEKYVDLTPTGKITVDSAATYYDLVVLPNRAYYPTSFALLSDNVWELESKVIGNESTTYDGINMTFNQKADRSLLSDNNLYANCYKYILRSNIVISQVDGSIGSPEVKALAKAEARLMRAWDHFILVNTFAKAYDPATAARDGGVAIIDTYDLEATPKKSSVAAVYDFIIRDIEQALPLLEENPPTLYHPSKAFGYAFAARVYLFHRDWQKAKDAAEESLKCNGELIDYVAMAAAGGPTKVKTYAKTGNPEVLNYAYMGSYSDNPAYCYGMISPELVELFDATDYRMHSFFKTTGNSAYFFDAGSGAALWNTSLTYSKFQYMAVGMRTAEVYLTLAEAEARLGNLKEATDVLNRLRVKRIAGDAATLPLFTSQTQAVKAVADERRKELLFGFHRFWDLKRLNTEPEYAKTLTRTFPIVSTAVPQQTYTLEPGSELYIIPFPLSVREKNPYLTSNTSI